MTQAPQVESGERLGLIAGNGRFPIIFADASPQEMNALAEMTGGKAFDSKSKPLAAVFTEIRGYQ